MARLVLHLDGQVLAEYNMSKERYTIGRLPDNDIRIDHPAVSGHHALVINILSDSFLEDLNSTNGSYLNDAKLTAELPVPDHALLSIGNSRLWFTLRDFADPQAALEASREATSKPAAVQ